jgi:hypothetical protein
METEKDSIERELNDNMMENIALQKQKKEIDEEIKKLEERKKQLQSDREENELKMMNLLCELSEMMKNK